VKDNDIIIIAKGEMTIFKSALISGTVEHGEDEKPISVYCGRRNIEDLGVDLLYTLRTVLRICKRELYIEPDKIDEFMILTLITAMQMEQEEEKGENGIHDFIQERMTKMTKQFGKEL
jgi:hypothetical protein